MASAVTRALVVGGTGGVGYGIACRVAADAAASSSSSSTTGSGSNSKSTVIISGRTKPADMPHGNMEFRPLDASSMREIKEYADKLKASGEPKLDLLVLTQGIMTTAGRTETGGGEGIDRKMALHYYGRQALIRELEPVLADDAKVLVVLDGRLGDPKKLDWEDLDLKKPGTYSVRTAADHCISMTDGMVQQYAADQQQQKKTKDQTSTEEKRRHFVHAFPGLVKTNLGHQLPWYMRVPMSGLMKVMAVSPETCADNLVKGMYEVTASAEKEGRFWSCIDDKGRLVPNKTVWTEEQRNKLAEHTWGIVDAAMAAKK